MWGLWTLDFGLWTLDFGLWTLDFGLWTLDFGLWTLDFGSVNWWDVKGWSFGPLGQVWDESGKYFFYIPRHAERDCTAWGIEV